MIVLAHKERERVFQGKVNVIGLGYIGLPTAMMMAAHDIDVTGTDFNEELVDTLNSGKMTFQEEGIDELFNQARAKGIEFSTQYAQADVYIVCVPTPYDKQTKRIDASYVMGAVRSVLECAPRGAIVVVESTVSPGTMDKYVRPLLDEAGVKAGEDVHLVHAPERIIPGSMVRELVENARTIGADSAEVGEKIKELYSAFCQGDIEVTDIRTAELTKVVENTYRDVNIAFANELLKICRSDDLDVHEVIRIANKHPRVNILSPGPGVGGHCISVDPWFLVGDYPELATMIRQARHTNDAMPDYVLERAHSLARERGIDFSRVGFYGITYKEDVDDLRDSPTLQLLEKMAEHLAPEPKTFDPMLESQVLSNQYTDFGAFLADIDMMVIMVSHSHLREHADQVTNKTILDTRKTDVNWDSSNTTVLL